ncbi:MAG: Peptidase family [Paenibacillaceae bacterium]|jgi:Zn-dependent protease|nr:Peptidase family [Paenibacillaceae bacterium]
MDISGFFHLDTLLFRVAGLAIGVTAHEFAHALAAIWIGDPTPREQKRFTLNPLAHIGVLGTVVVLFGPFGWGKPVPYDPERWPPMTNRARTARVWLIGLVGPLSNLALGLFFWWLYFHLPVSANDYDSSVMQWVILVKGLLQYGYIVNLMMFIIQLLPLFPMDGWRIWRQLAPSRWTFALDKYERLVLIPLLALIITPFGQYILEMLFSAVTRAVMFAYSVV